MSFLDAYLVAENAGFVARISLRHKASGCPI